MEGNGDGESRNGSNPRPSQAPHHRFPSSLQLTEYHGGEWGFAFIRTTALWTNPHATTFQDWQFVFDWIASQFVGRVKYRNGDKSRTVVVIDCQTQHRSHYS